MTALLIAVIGAMTLVHYLRPDSLMTQMKTERNLLVAERLYNEMKWSLTEAVSDIRHMVLDQEILDNLKSESGLSSRVMEERMAAPLSRFMDLEGYDTAYVISDRTRKYYTSQGIYKIVDQEKDSRDLWYSVFVNSGHEMDVDVDVDEGDVSKWMLYIHGRIEGEDGTLLGVAGIGMEVSQFQSLFAQIQDQYGFDVSLVDEKGMVMVDVDHINVEQVYLSGQNYEVSDDFVYTQKDGIISITKYIEELGWFLVLQENVEARGRSFDATFLILSAFLLMTSLGIMNGVLNLVFEKKKNSSAGGDYDELTGLPNRNYFKKVYGERGIFNTTRYQALAVFDIDFFKEANDRLDGDAVLVDVTSTAGEIMGEDAEIFRWGGDEFTVLMRTSLEESYRLCRTFCDTVAQHGLVTVSVGVVKVRLSDTIKKNYYRAAQGCYLVKEMGGNGVKKVEA